MTNPRKFSEKIALHNQKQAEETAAFERIMQEVSVTRVIVSGFVDFLCFLSIYIFVFFMMYHKLVLILFFTKHVLF